MPFYTRLTPEGAHEFASCISDHLKGAKWNNRCCLWKVLKPTEIPFPRRLGISQKSVCTYVCMYVCVGFCVPCVWMIVCVLCACIYVYFCVCICIMCVYGTWVCVFWCVCVFECIFGWVHLYVSVFVLVTKHPFLVSTHWSAQQPVGEWVSDLQSFQSWEMKSLFQWQENDILLSEINCFRKGVLRIVMRTSHLPIMIKGQTKQTTPEH